MVYRPTPEILRSLFSHELPALIFDLGGVLLGWRPRDFVLDLLNKSPVDAWHVDSASHVDNLMGIVFQDYSENSDWVALDLNLIDLQTLVRFLSQTRVSADSLNTDRLSQVVFFDDHPVNVHSARAFGWTAIRFENVEQSKIAFINRS